MLLLYPTVLSVGGLVPVGNVPTVVSDEEEGRLRQALHSTGSTVLHRQYSM
jgi:hypothetical protein